MTAPGGEDTGGRGTSGIVEEKTREARAGETDTTRFGMEDGADTDGEGTGGMVKKADAGGRPGTAADATADQGGASGTKPGGAER